MNVTGGDTNITTYFVMRLTSNGQAATGLTITNFDLQYTRTGAPPTAKVDATALAATNSSHSDNKAIQIDATDQPGLYRVDWPDAACAAAARQVILTVKVATCFTEHLAVNIDTPVDATKLGNISTTAVTLPAQGAPSATAPLATALAWLYKTFRNKKTQTATQWNLYNDDSTTIDSKATVSSDGTTTAKAEIASGP